MSTNVFIISLKKVYAILEVIAMNEQLLDAKIVGESISRLRRKKNISQEVMSGLAGIGRTHLSAIERGDRKPTLETLYRISLALNMKMSEIVAEIENSLCDKAKKR